MSVPFTFPFCLESLHISFPILPMFSHEKEQVEQGALEQPRPERRYPAPHIDDVRAQIRELGVSDPDRLLPPYYWGEFANNT